MCSLVFYLQHLTVQGFGPWVTYNGNYSSAWRPEFERSLGAPQADAQYNAVTQVWIRGFASGTTVTFDASTNTGTVVWAV